MDRRITIQQPVTVADAHNEQSTEWEAVFVCLPAAMEPHSGGSEDERGNMISAAVTTEWTTRFISPRPQANWRILDEYSGLVYDIVAPPVEMGRRQGLNYKTAQRQ